MKKLLLSAIVICVTFNLSAQVELPKEYIYTGLSFAGSKDVKAFNMPVALSHSIGGNKHFRYIVGLRQNLAFGAAEFTFNDQKTWIDDISNYSINVMGGFEWMTSKKFVAGFTLDLFGGTVGTRSYKTVGTDPVYKVSPESVNLLFSQGTVCSEFYIGYQISEHMTVKAGFSANRLGLLYINNRTPSTSASTFLNMPFVHLQYNLWDQ